MRPKICWTIFEQEFVRLEKNPEKHSFVFEEPWRSEGIRWTKVKHFLVYYWIDIEKAAVQITGIVYGKRRRNIWAK